MHTHQRERSAGQDGSELWRPRELGEEASPVTLTCRVKSQPCNSVVGSAALVPPSGDAGSNSPGSQEEDGVWVAPLRRTELFPPVSTGGCTISGSKIVSSENNRLVLTVELCWRGLSSSHRLFPCRCTDFRWYGAAGICSGARLHPQTNNICLRLFTF